MSRRNINSCKEGVDLNVSDFIKWLLCSNNAALPFVLKDMFCSRNKWLCYCLLVHNVQSVGAVVVRSIPNRGFGHV